MAISATMADEINAALDYLDACTTGLPAYVETVAGHFGHGKIARGQSTLLLLLIAGAAQETDQTGTEIIQRMRENYGEAERNDDARN
jgi:hypothetical protein